MRKTHVVRVLLVITGLVLLVGTILFDSYSWWPAGLKVKRELESGIVFGGAILVSLYVAWTTWETIRGRTSRVFSQNQDWGFNRNDGLEPAGQFFLLRLGGVNVPAMLLSTHGHEGTLIMPSDSVREYGRNIVVSGVSRRMYYNELPPEVRRVAKKRGYIPPYSVVTHPVALETRGRDYLHLTHLRQRRDLAENSVEDTLRRTTRANDYANRALADRIEDLGKPSKLRGIKAFFSPATDDDERPMQKEQ